jgi:hypothetical protein
MGLDADEGRRAARTVKMNQNLRAARHIAREHRTEQWHRASSERSTSGQLASTAPSGRTGLSLARSPFSHRVARLFIGRAGA